MYLPTIIAITVAFFVGVGVGIFLCGFTILGSVGLLSLVPQAKEKVFEYLKNW